MSQLSINRRAFSLSLLAGTGLVASGASLARTSSSQPIARTRYGPVRGLRRNEAEVFLGMPYGGSTKGTRRFLPPVAPAPWIEVRDATKLGPRAPQLGEPLYTNPVFGNYYSGGHAAQLIAMNEPMDEDCLVLNVITPRADNRARPVMVYIHGGGFTSGSGAIFSFADRLAVEEDVVVVTLNHRLNVFGFLYLGAMSERYAAGNPSMLDLVAALEWVRDNIAYFGGDPTKVTIFGESGGAGKVGFLLAMPQAKGLFRAAIMESTAPLTPSTSQAATDVAKTYLDRLSLNASDLDGLAAVPAARFLELVDPSNPLAFGPIRDGKTLSGSLWDQGAPSIAADIPLIIGVCKDEESIFTGLAHPETFTLSWAQVSPKLSEFSHVSEPKLAPVIDAYRRTYPNESATDIFFRLLSMVGFGLGRFGRNYADLKSIQPAPVYYYRNEFDTRLAPGVRAFHTSELPLACRMVADPRAEGLSKQIAGAWAAFARTGGNPDHAGMPHWGRYRAGSDGPIMIFDIKSRCGVDPEENAQQRARALFEEAHRS